MVDAMTKTKLNFYCPSATVKIIDRMAKDDHRDRTSMLNKMVEDYITTHTTPSNGTKPKQPGDGATAERMRKASREAGQR
jgi:polyribonucleotide nucleotidyltransferase